MVLQASCLLCLPTRIVAYATSHPTNRPHRLGLLPFSFIGTGKGEPRHFAGRVLWEEGQRRQPETLTGVIVWFCWPPVCCAYLLGSLHTQRCIRLTDHTDLAAYLSVSLEQARGVQTLCKKSLASGKKRQEGQSKGNLRETLS